MTRGTIGDLRREVSHSAASRASAEPLHEADQDETDHDKAGQAVDIAIISLAGADARRASVRARMESTGLAFRFMDAVSTVEEATDIAGPSDDEKFLLNTGRRPVPGELACYASHVSLWRRCVETGMPLLVMEDDFRLRPGFCRAVAVASQLVREVGFVRLQAEQRAVRRTVCAVGPFSLVRYRKMTQGAMCYLLGPTAAEALLRASPAMTSPVDVFIKRYWEHGQHLFGLLPYTVEPSAIAWQSQIGERRKAVKCWRTHLRRSLHRAAGWGQRHYFNLGNRPPFGPELTPLGAAGGRVSWRSADTILRNGRSSPPG